MKPADELPIEPLSEAAWQRVEQVVFDALDELAQSVPPARPRARRWPLVALAALVAIQAVLALLFLYEPVGDDARASLDSARFATGREATETLLGDVAISIEPASALVVVKDAAAGSLVVLERGAARFSVPPRERRPAFVVQAGDVRVEVVGTRFRVERVKGSASVHAYEGVVRVIAGGRSALLRRGEHWPLATAAPPELATREVQSAGPKTVTPEPQPTSRDASPPQTAATDRQKRFEQAALLEAGDPEQALRLYRGLAAEGGRWGENALYAMGRLEMERGRRAAAARILSNYLARHPQGGNASDARALLERLEHKPRGTP
jgi:hypothetical protein